MYDSTNQTSFPQTFVESFLIIKKHIQNQDLASLIEYSMCDLHKVYIRQATADRNKI